MFPDWLNPTIPNLADLGCAFGNDHKQEKDH